METKTPYLNDLKFNIDTWKRELRFHLDEMDNFKEKLDELIARHELDIIELKKLDIFQNRILIEKDAIAKLKHRCKNLLKSINNLVIIKDLNNTIYEDQQELRDDMRNYIRLHYDLKEKIMDFVLENS
jgi:hypothetical protein